MSVRLLFIIPTLSSAYHQNRVNELLKLGANCSVAGFQRDYYKGKEWEAPVNSLGYVEHGNYLKRMKTLLKSIPSIRKQSNSMDAVVCFNLDLLIITWLGLFGMQKKPKLIYDVGDIRSVLIERGAFSFLLRQIEKFLLNRIHLLIITSQAYLDEYFRKIQGWEGDNYLILENKLNKENTPKPIKQPRNPDKPKKEFIIGYNGLIRCRDSLLFLDEMTKISGGKFKVIINGIFLNTDDLKPMIDDNPYMDYRGAFTFPDDLAKIHDGLDFSWLVHAHSKLNSKWARIFRFYHACFYKVPMIALADSQDGKDVYKYNVGLCIDLEEPELAKTKLLSIDRNNHTTWKQNLVTLDDSVYLLKDEYERFLSYI